MITFRLFILLKVQFTVEFLQSPHNLNNQNKSTQIFSGNQVLSTFFLELESVTAVSAKDRNIQRIVAAKFGKFFLTIASFRFTAC